MEKPFNVMFEGNRTINYKGDVISRYYEFTEPGFYELKFTFLNSNSKLNQAIVIIFYEFDGKLELEEKSITLRKKTFNKIHFFEKTSPKSFSVKIELKSGDFSICNGSDPIGNMTFSHSMTLNCAMIEEKISDNKIIFHCNDHEFDDDFDDLVFELEIVNIKTK